MASSSSVYEGSPGNPKCTATTGIRAISLVRTTRYIVCFIIYLAICNAAHLYLKRLSQPRIISETIGGLIFSQLFNSTTILGSALAAGTKNMKFIADFGMICYMFVLGLEMEPTILVEKPKQAAWISFAGLLVTFSLACGTMPFSHYSVEKVTSKAFIGAIALFLSNTGSPLLTRVLTDLKIGKSEVGQLAIAAAVHTELVATLLLSIGYVVFQPESNFEVRGKRVSLNKIFYAQPGLHIGAALVGQVALVALIGPVVLRWVNNANPKGKTMKGSHLVLSLTFIVSAGSISSFLGYSPVLSAFVTGVFLPREGRISRFMVSKMNYFLSFLFYPFFFFWLGIETEFSEFVAEERGSWLRLFSFYLIGTSGKIVGSFLSAGFVSGLHWQDCLALGLLLNVKGHFHFYATIIAKKNNIISDSTCVAIILAMLFKVICVPPVAAYISQHDKQRFPNQRMSLQWHDPSQEICMLLCCQGPQNIPAAINVIEMISSQDESNDAGLVVCAADVVELTDSIAATMDPPASGGGDGGALLDDVSVNDKGVMQMRQEITTLLGEYTEEIKNVGKDITLRRMLALSTFSNMHNDICFLAESSRSSLIVLPFHKTLQSDGTLDSGHSGFRYTNRKVLRSAPCSVAILVDRGLGTLYQISKSQASLNAGVIFIGGKDDREALAYASRAAHHPGVKLTVIRFLLDTDSEGLTNLGALTSRVRVAEQEQQMKLDDECFANFYEKHIAKGRVAYFEKHLVNSAQVYSTLKSLEGQYGLFIVGRGGKSNSVLTVGMNDLEQCPELGPLGDILSGTAFSSTASVLIFQQHIPRGEEGAGE